VKAGAARLVCPCPVLHQAAAESEVRSAHTQLPSSVSRPGQPPRLGL